MPTLFPYQPFKGLIPGVDPKQVQQQYCVDGNNFMLDAKSVYTAFGSHIAHSVPVDYPVGAKTFKLDDSSTIAVCTQSGIYLLTGANTPYITLWQPSTQVINNWPWTYSYVAGTHYFCRRGYGIISYNPNTATVTKLSSVHLPSNPSFIAAVNGRLVVLGDNFYCWSAFDDGSNFATSTTTKAGAQFLSLIGGGEPRALLPTLKGLYVATTKGLIKATYVDTGTLFEHDVVEGASLAPVDPNSWVQLDDQRSVVLAQSGLFMLTESNIELWEAAMSEYIHRYVTPSYRAAATGVLALSYLDNLKYLFISQSTASVEGTYTKAFVFDFLRGEWGSFDQLHTSVGPVPVYNTELYQWEYGFIDSLGFIRKFVELPQREATISSGDVYIPLAEIEPIIVDGDTAFSSAMLMTSFSTDELPNIAAIYTVTVDDLLIEAADIPTEIVPTDSAPNEDWNLMDAVYSEDWNAGTAVEDWNATAGFSFSSLMAFTCGLSQSTSMAQAKEFGNLISSVKVGPYRLTDQQYPNRLSYVNHLTISMDNPVSVSEYEDWNIDAPAEDWNLLTGVEDWGEVAIAASDYTASVLSTVDGHERYNTDEGLLTLAVEHGDTKLWATYSNGVYHFVDISAEAEAQAFRLNHLELSGNLGGLYF